jgi:hypothetical protein
MSSNRTAPQGTFPRIIRRFRTELPFQKNFYNTVANDYYRQVIRKATVETRWLISSKLVNLPGVPAASLAASVWANIARDKPLPPLGTPPGPKF